MNKKRVVKVLFTAAFLGATGIFYSCSEQSDSEVLLLETTSPEPSIMEEVTEIPVATAVSSNKIYVYLCGQVNQPDVYELCVGARVKDVVELAGGFTSQAAPECVNLARVVEDGEQIYIPSLEEKEQGEFTCVGEDRTDNGKENTQTSGTQVININSADASELMTLPGIGEAKAAAIIAYRDQHGKFQSTEELMNITGIKTGLYTKIKDHIKVN